MTFSFPVDVLNPGHYFACCGIQKIADEMYDNVYGHFSNDQFILDSEQGNNILQSIINKLIPDGINIDDIIITSTDDKDSPIYIKTIDMYLDFWNHLDSRPTLKLFAGRQTSRDIITNWLKQINKVRTDPLLFSDPFSIETYDNIVPSGFDTSTSTNSIDLGFSVNDLRTIQTVLTKVHPIVELFAHIGCQTHSWYKTKSDYIYNIWYQSLPIMIASAVANNAIDIECTRKISFRTQNSGKVKVLIRGLYC